MGSHRHGATACSSVSHHRPPTRWYRCTSTAFPGFRDVDRAPRGQHRLPLDYGPNWRVTGFLPCSAAARWEKHFPSSCLRLTPMATSSGASTCPRSRVPLATYTGWNLRDPSIGGAGLRLPSRGRISHSPRNAVERKQAGDPRKSIAERYPDREAYLTQFARATDELIRQRWILPEDRAPLLQRRRGKSGTPSRTNRTSGQLQGTIFNQNSAVQISDRRAA